MSAIFTLMGISILIPKQESTVEKSSEDTRGKALMLKIAANDRKVWFLKHLKNSLSRYFCKAD